LKRRPEVQQATAAATQIVHEEVADLVAKATEKMDRAPGTKAHSDHTEEHALTR
jgi:hypothetical protein